jgi:hypothetical protein
VRIGTNVQPAYFDQMREALDPEKTVMETIAPGSDWVELAGGRKHVMSYLNPPTTWTSSPSNCSKRRCRTTRAPCCW